MSNLHLDSGSVMSSHSRYLVPPTLSSGLDAQSKSVHSERVLDEVAEIQPARLVWCSLTPHVSGYVISTCRVAGKHQERQDSARHHRRGLQCRIPHNLWHPP
jgi:hypothetical protein